MTYTGKLILVVGVSGSGKGVLMQAARKHFPGVVFPVSCTTRAMRPGEVDGGPYHFLTEEAFDAKIAKGEFLEWEPYGGYRYGTLKGEIFPPLEAGKTVLHEVEIYGARHFKKLVPGADVSVIYILAGDWESLKRRILARAPMSDEDLEKRRLRFEEEIQFKREADIIIENRDGALAEAEKRFIEAIEKITR